MARLCVDHVDTQPTLSKRQARWSEYLQRFNFTWQYRPGRTNVADPLSRNPTYRTAMISAVVARVFRASLYVSTRSRTANRVPKAVDLGPDWLPPPPVIQQDHDVTNQASGSAIPADDLKDSAPAPHFPLQDAFTEGYTSDPEYPITMPQKHRLLFLDGLWWFNDRIAVPDVPSLRQHLMQAFPDSTYAGQQDAAQHGKVSLVAKHGQVPWPIRGYVLKLSTQQTALNTACRPSSTSGCS